MKLARWMLVLLVVLSACRRRPRDELAAQIFAEPSANPATLPRLVLKDDTADLLLTWVDAKGDVHVVTKPADVPAEGRDQVRVEITTADDIPRDLLYVANLTTPGADGTYPVSVKLRSEWEAMIAKRREELLRAHAPEQVEGTGSAPSSSDRPSAAAVTVIVYGASWCEACHQAMQYFQRRKVPAIEKDIEKDPGAEAEMRAKLTRAGLRSSSIPVIDIKGKILVGFEPHAVEQALAGASTITL